MSHGLNNSIVILRRWAAHTDLPLPEDFKQFQQKNPSEALLIERNDPELASLLLGTAPAGLRADALEGKISENAPDPVERQQAELREEVQDLFDRRDELNFTEKLRLSLLDPKVFRNAMAQVDTDKEQTEEDKAMFRRQSAAQRANEVATSMNHSMSQIRGGN